MDIETKKTEYSIIGDLGIIVNKELREEIDRIKYQVIIDKEAIKALRTELSDEEILDSISSCVALGLCVTEQCVFRCRYCVYSGNYIGERIHSNKKMDLNTAKKAVNLFFQLLLNKRRKSKIRKIFVGFYGGECLSEFELIKDIIHYAESTALATGINKIFNLRFRITTNGYLLDNEEIIEFLKENQLSLDISIDGPEKEHDKFRVTRKGEKTWARIMSNIKKIKERYPLYYDNNVNYLVTVHPNHDVNAIERFFLENKHLFGDGKIKFNNVNILGLKEEETAKINKKTRQISNMQYLQLKNEIEKNFHFRTRSPGTNFTGTCFPGAAKLFVDADGNLNVCESIVHNAPKLGDVEKGLDYDSIRKIIRDYNEEIIKNRCWECDKSPLCNVCIAKAYQNGKGIRFDCNSSKADSLLLKTYLEDKEKEDESQYTGNNHTDITAFMDSLQ